MKTIVLFFVLCAFAVAAAKHNKKHKAQETEAPEESTHDWPQPQSIGEYGVPEEYGGTGSGPSLPSGQAPGDQGDGGRAHVEPTRRHRN